MPLKNNTLFEISIASVIKIILVLLALWFLYLIKDIVLILFVTIIFAAAIDPWVDYFQRKKIPRTLGIVSIYVVGLGLLSLLIAMLVPAMTREITSLARDFPTYYNKIIVSIEGFQAGQDSHNVRNILDSWASNLGGATKSVFSTIGGIFGGFVSLFAILVITFYLIVKKDNMRVFLQTVTPSKYQAYIIQIYTQIQRKVGQWLKGQLVLMLIIAILSYVGLLLLGVKYSLILGLFAGVTEIIPYIGPVIGAVPAIFIAFTQSPFKGLLVLILYILIQQLENHIIVPKVMNRAVGLNPIVVILVILIGGKLAGILGALVAVPIATVFSVIIKDLFETKKIREAG